MLTENLDHGLIEKTGSLQGKKKKKLQAQSPELQNWFSVVFHVQGWASIWWALPQEFTKISIRIKGVQRSLGRKLSCFKQYKIQYSGVSVPYVFEDEFEWLK